MTREDLAKLPLFATLLEELDPEARLGALKNLAENNGGIWTVPARPDRYAPVMYDVRLCGVTVSDPDPARLPALWIKAARNIIRADQQAA